MAVQSLNVDLSNAAICGLSCRGCVYEKRPTEFSGFLSLENKRQGGGGGGRGGRHNQLGTLIIPAVLYRYTRSWILIHQVIGS